MKTAFKLKTLAAMLLLASAPAIGQGIPGQPMVPLGNCQISAAQLASAVGLSACSGGIPTGATMAYLQAEVANVRYRDDGTAPTTAVGNLVVFGAVPGTLYTGTLSKLQFIAASGSPLLDVAFYR